MYALIHNNQIQVGPRQWSWSFFKDYLDEEGLDASQLPRVNPNTPIITAEWKIVPVTIDPMPAVDSPFEQLAGPFLTINDESVTGHYSTAPVAIESIKNTLKATVTANRYTAEIAGTKYTLTDGTEVTVLTNREERGTYVDAYNVLADGQSIVFKFPRSIFKNITKTELGQIVDAGAAYIRDVFVWESNKYTEIDTANDTAALKAIELRHPTQIPTEV